MEKKKHGKLYTKWWFWVILLVIIVIVSFTSIILFAFTLINPDEGLSKLAKSLQEYHKDTMVYQSYDKSIINIDVNFDTQEEALESAKTIGKILGENINGISLFKEIVVNTSTKDGMRGTYVLDIATRELKNEKTEDWVLNNSSIYNKQQEEVNKLKSTKEELEKTKTSLNDEIQKLKEEVVKIKGEPKKYPAGQLTAGTDIPLGKYKIYGGNSNFTVHSSYGDLKVNIILGGSYGVEEYIYTFQQGDKIDARSSFYLVAVE